MKIKKHLSVFAIFSLVPVFVLSFFKTPSYSNAQSLDKMKVVRVVSGKTVAETQTSDGKKSRFVADELIVTIDKNRIVIKDKNVVDEVNLKFMGIRNGINKQEEIWDQNLIVYKLKKGEDIFEVKKKLEKQSIVKNVTLNYQFEPHTINDNDISDTPHISRKGEILKYRVVAYNKDGDKDNEEEIEVSVPWVTPKIPEAKKYTNKTGSTVSTNVSVYSTKDYYGIVVPKVSGVSTRTTLVDNDYYGIVVSDEDNYKEGSNYSAVLGTQTEYFEIDGGLENENPNTEKLSLFQRIKNKIKTWFGKE